jgi:hypothetical protein
MITLETNQPALTDPEWFVREGGTYAPDALVDLYRASDPSQTCALYALTIATGEYPA